MIISDILEGFSKFTEGRGIRKTLWVFLLIGISLLVFESATQYFAISNLNSRISLLDKMSKLSWESSQIHKIRHLQSELLIDAEQIQLWHTHPEEYLVMAFFRFVKGAYLVLPFFYFLMRISIFLLSKSEEKTKQYVFYFGSMAFSSIAWFATILGAISIIWNTSDNFIVSTFVFPVASLLGAFVILLWLIILRIIIPGKKRNSQKMQSSTTEPLS